MTTAQDQQSRELLPCPFCGGAPVQLRTPTYGNHGSDPQDVFTIQCCVSMRVSDYPGYLTDAVIRALKDKWNSGAPAVQAARALPAGMEPVAEIVECGVMGQQTVAEVDGAWKFLPIGTKLYTAVPVQALLAHRGHGEGANQLQTRMDAGAPPGAGLPHAGGQVDCIGLALELESQAQRVESQSVERAMAAAAQALRLLAITEPQAPTTGAGSATPEATQERKPLTDEQVQDLIGFGDPTEQERYLVCLGWNAAHGIK